MGLWAVEVWLLPLAVGRKLAHAAGNGLFVLGALPVQIAMSALCVVVTAWVANHQWGLVYLLPDSVGVAGRWLAAFVMLDFLDYAYHLSMHKLPFLWRFHKAHHADSIVDVSTTVREHPCETFVRNAYLLLWVCLTGATVEVLVLRQLAETAINPWAHTGVRLPDAVARYISWLVVTPNFHRVHHHARLPHTDSNFGDVFTVWDRLFGTLRHLPERELAFGLLAASVRRS